MSIADRYKAYADAFEESYADDDWSRLAEYFTPDAIYKDAEGPGADVSGRDALLKRLKTGVDGFDRRADSRTLEFAKGPEVQGDQVVAEWRATYTKAGAPDLVITGVERATFEGDAIKVLHDEFDPDAMERLQSWVAQHLG